jgi:hypothetical protein
MSGYGGVRTTGTGRVPRIRLPVVQAKFRVRGSNLLRPWLDFPHRIIVSIRQAENSIELLKPFLAIEPSLMKRISIAFYRLQGFGRRRQVRSAQRMTRPQSGDVSYSVKSVKSGHGW